MFQVDAIIPLLALVFPVMWLLLTDYGAATVLAAFENPELKKKRVWLNSRLVSLNNFFKNMLFFMHV